MGFGIFVCAGPPEVEVEVEVDGGDLRKFMRRAKRRYLMLSGMASVVGRRIKRKTTSEMRLLMLRVILSPQSASRRKMSVLRKEISTIGSAT